MAGFGVKNPGGRPKIWETPESLELEIKEYFDEYQESGKPLTLERLALRLDVDRDTILRYSKDEKFYGVIKRAKEFIISTSTERLQEKGSNVIGSIFYLKNRADFVDKREVDMTGDFTMVSLGGVDDDDDSDDEEGESV